MIIIVGQTLFFEHNQIMFSASISAVLDEITKSLGLASLLYPLERIQSIKQIQSTYADSEVRQTKSIITRSTHNGIKTYFIGYMPFIGKLGILNLSSKFTEFGLKSRSEYQSAMKILNFGFATVGYFLTYPLEVVNIRMSAEVDGQRFYTNTRQCLAKIRKTEGIKAIYKGFFWAYSVFTLQFVLLQQLQTNYIGYLDNMTQWQKISATFSAIGASQLLLYPLNSLKKIYQINGAIGHTDENFNIRLAFRHSKLTQLWKGFQIRLSNILIYSLLYFIFFNEQNLRKQ